MGLIGGLIGGVASAVGGIAGGIAGRRAARRNERILNRAQDRAQDWYDKEYYSDFTQRSDAQAALNSARQILDERYRRAQGSAAVTGATDESVAQQKAANNQVIADVTSNIAERADAYKEQVRSNYENQMNAIDEARMGINNRRAQNVATAAGGLATAGALASEGISDDVLKGTRLGQRLGI